LRKPGTPADHPLIRVQPAFGDPLNQLGAILLVEGPDFVHRGIEFVQQRIETMQPMDVFAKPMPVLDV